MTALSARLRMPRMAVDTWQRTKARHATLQIGQASGSLQAPGSVSLGVFLNPLHPQLS